MKQLLISFWKDENGQTSTEYILLVAVVALIVFKFRNTATTQIDKITNQIFSGMGNIANDIQNASSSGN